MTAIIRRILLFLISLLLYWGGALLFACLVSVSRPIILKPTALVYVLSAVAGLFLFSRWRFNCVYVFGHETTHWLVAKLFLKDTGKMRLGSSGGSVEIAGSNVWITLAPYIIPFYVLLAIALLGISQIFWYPTPQYGIFAFGVVTGLAYAYHLVMTHFVLRQQQSDLEIYGRFFSFSLIAFGNILLLLLAVVMASRQWPEARAFLANAWHVQWGWIQQLVSAVRRIRIK